MFDATQPDISNGRRDFLRASLATGVILGLGPLSSEAADVTQRNLLEQDLPNINLEGWEFQASELTFPPGYVSSSHRHSGFVIGCVLEGEFRFQLEGMPAVVLKKGQIFYEPPGVRHLMAASASYQQSARVLAISFGPKGKPMTVNV